MKYPPISSARQIRKLSIILSSLNAPLDFFSLFVGRPCVPLRCRGWPCPAGAAAGSYLFRKAEDRHLRGMTVSRGKFPPPGEHAACPSDRKSGGWEGSQPARRSPAVGGLSRSNQPPLLPALRDRGVESEGENVFLPLCRSHIIQISKENQAVNYHKILVSHCADLLKSHIFCRL